MIGLGQGGVLREELQQVGRGGGDLGLFEGGLVLLGLSGRGGRQDQSQPESACEESVAERMSKAREVNEAGGYTTPP